MRSAPAETSHSGTSANGASRRGVKTRPHLRHRSSCDLGRENPLGDEGRSRLAMRPLPQAVQVRALNCLEAWRPLLQRLAR
eukprot:6396980-Pyramimonas_sp.AAC.1